MITQVGDETLVAALRPAVLVETLRRDRALPELLLPDNPKSCTYAENAVVAAALQCVADALAAKVRARL
jgi:hypothetical protein